MGVSAKEIDEMKRYELKLFIAELDICKVKNDETDSNICMNVLYVYKDIIADKITQ